ncbi:hypothetical protein EXS65_04395 [Candidatus Peribacteria bacterium]|nr:hypothetical protein [Candidatus Peribacteria bacterium]
MKHGLLLSTGVLMTLVACGGGQQTIIQTMTIRSPEASKTMALIQATERVMNRRLAGAGIQNAHASTIPTGTNTATLTLTLPDATAVAKANSILSEQFTFDLRIEEPKKNEDGTSDWEPTALTGSNLLWVQAVGNNATGEIAIELQFSEAGRTILESVFSKNAGKHIGIFVRDLLVSKVSVTNGAVADTVIIGGIPSAKVAEIFSDDVNVGLLVSFTPAP